MNRKIVLWIVTIIYIVSVISAAAYFFGKRDSAKVYSYDLSYCNMDAGELLDNSIYIDENYNQSGVFCKTLGAQLREGDYHLAVRYTADADNQLHLYANSNCEQYVGMPAGIDSVVTSDFTVSPATDDFRIWFIYNGIGNLSISEIIIASEQPIYTDYEYYAVLVLLLAVIVPLTIIYLHRVRKLTGKERGAVAVYATLAILVNIPVMRDYLWLGIDTRPHLMRMDGVAGAITAGRFPSIIYSNYCNDFGELSCIYPDKFLYLPGFLRSRGVSLYSSYATMHFIINIAALIIMYACVKHITKSSKVAYIAGILFCFAPYRLYVMNRGGQTFGMGIALLFFPILFTGLYEVLIGERKKWYLLSFGLAGMVWSHILSAVLGMVLCVVIFIACEIINIVNKRNVHKDIVAALCKAIGVFVLLTVSTIVPLVYYEMYGLAMEKLSLEFMDSLGSFTSNFLSASGIFHVVLMIVFAVLCVWVSGKRKKEREFTQYGVLMTVIGFGLFLMSTNVFPWRIFMKIPLVRQGLSMFQFGERFMLAGISAVIIGISMTMVELLDNDVITIGLSRKVITVIIPASIIVIGSVFMFTSIAKCPVWIPDRMTGDIYYRQLGYLPAGTEMSYYDSAVPNCGDWDSLQHLSYIKNGTDIHYEYICSLDNNYIEFPLFNYPGYRAYDGEGKELEIINSDHNRILVMLDQSESVQTIDVEFKVYPIFTILAVVSLCAVIGTGGYMVLNWRHGKHLECE